MKTLLDLIRAIDQRSDAHIGQREQLATFIREVKRREVKAWQACVDLTLTPFAQALARAEAHVLCELLGDQDALFRHLDHDRIVDAVVVHTATFTTGYIDPDDWSRICSDSHDLGYGIESVGRPDSGVYAIRADSLCELHQFYLDHPALHDRANWTVA